MKAPTIKSSSGLKDCLNLSPSTAASKTIASQENSKSQPSLPNNIFKKIMRIRNPLTLVDLGGNVVNKVKAFTDPRQVARLECVSKDWQKVISKEGIWKTFRQLQVERMIEKNQLFDRYNVKSYISISNAKQIFESYHGKNILLKLNSQVYRKDVATNLYKKAFSHPYPFMCFGPELWAYYFGDIGLVPPLPANIREILNSPCPFNKGFWPFSKTKKKEETHLLVLIPATLNGQPMTLKRLGALMHTHDSKLDQSGYKGIFGGHDDTPFDTSHWVLMTKDVIKGSRSKSYAQQQALVARYPGYQVPKLSEAATSIYMHYVVTGQRLYNNFPLTYTRCQEKYNAHWHMAVGDFAPAGLDVNFDGNDDDTVGVAGLWKF